MKNEKPKKFYFSNFYEGNWMNSKHNRFCLIIADNYFLFIYLAFFKKKLKKETKGKKIHIIIRYYHI